MRIVHQIGRKGTAAPAKEKIRGGTRDDAGKTSDSKPLERDTRFKDEGDAGGVLNG